MQVPLIGINCVLHQIYRHVGRLQKPRGNTAEVEEVTNEGCGGVPVEGDLFGYSRSRVGTKSQRLEQHDKTTRTTWRKHQTPPCRRPGMIMCCVLLFFPCCFHVWREMDLSCDTCTCDSCISVEDKITGVEEHVDIDMTDACASQRYLLKCNGCSRPFIRRRASRHEHRENQLHDRKMHRHPWKHVEQPLINPRMHDLIQALVHLLPLARCLTHGHAPVVMPLKIILLAAATDLGIETAAEKRKCAANQWKRIWKGRRRAKRVNRLCKMNSDAQKLTVTGNHPVQVYGHSTGRFHRTGQCDVQELENVAR